VRFVSVKQKGTNPSLHGYSSAQKRVRIVEAHPSQYGYFCSAHFRKHPFMGYSINSLDDTF
jgi:hypothetical protein